MNQSKCKMKMLRGQNKQKGKTRDKNNIKKISKFPYKKTQQNPTPPTQTPKNPPPNQNNPNKKNT